MSGGGADNFCLKWNDFEKNISRAFKDLRNDKDFFDVTLAFGDNQLQAHKVILSACSPFFRSVLKRNPHQHPLLYLKGVGYESMLAVLNFMYHGEVNVAQDDLNKFLAVAEDLQIKGLTQSEKQNTHPAPISPPVELPEINHKRFTSRSVEPEPLNKVAKVKQQVVEYRGEVEQVNVKTETPFLVEQETISEVQEEDMEYHQQPQQYDYQGGYEVDHQGEQYNTEQGMEDNSTGDDAVDFDEYVNQNSIKLSENRQIQCLLCNKLTAHVGNMKQHFEVHHYQRHYKCDTCQKDFKTKNSLDVHKKHQGHY